MKKLYSQILLTALSILFAVALPRPALADACTVFARFMKPEITVVALEGDVHYDTGHTVREITAIARSDPNLS